MGVWLETIERIDETLIGTNSCVAECSAVNRLSSENWWDRAMVMQMRELPWEPVLGKHGVHIAVDVGDNGGDLEGDHGRDDKPIEVLDDDVPVETRGGMDKLHVSRKAITKYGMIPGCPGCNALARGGQTRGKLV